MRFIVRLAFRAERDLDEILAYLKNRSPSGAATRLRRWTEVCKSLEADPRQHVIAMESEQFDEYIRQVVFKTHRGRPYRAVFVIRENRVFITHIRGPGQELVPETDLPFK